VVSDFQLDVTAMTYYEFSYMLTSLGDSDNYWASAITTIVIGSEFKATKAMVEEFSSVRAFDDTPRVFYLLMPPGAAQVQIAFTAQHVSPPLH
jgi:hypothetical protein